MNDPRTELGESLWPSRLSKDVLDGFKMEMGSYAYEGQYQQSPNPREGGLFKINNLQVVYSHDLPEDFYQYSRIVRGWDLANTDTVTSSNPDWTCGVKMALYQNPNMRYGRYYIFPVARWRKSPYQNEMTIKQTLILDEDVERQSFPQDPGQAGKGQKFTFLSNFQGFPIRFSPETGKKSTRAESFAAQVEAGNVYLIKRSNQDLDSWIEPYIAELKSFPTGAHDDQVDASSRAFNELTIITKQDNGFKNGIPNPIGVGQNIHDPSRPIGNEDSEYKVHHKKLNGNGKGNGKTALEKEGLALPVVVNNR
jgi:predicted phage terminase large subunit-like protein